jgi:lipid II isoglutaminyl synthase (glutamine-hydrolysing)
MTQFTIATLFPLDTAAAGDDANAAALVRRAHQRGIEATRTTVNRPEAMVHAAIYLLGGEGTTGVTDLVAHLRATDLADRVRAGRSIIFAVDAGLAAIGRTWRDASGHAHPGLGLVGVDIRATRGAARTVVTRPVPALGLPPMLGWESGQAGLTRDPDVAPLAELEGMGPAAGTDGVLADGVLGTLMHGPVLALNPELADLVLARALGTAGWDPLPIAAVDTARARRIAEVSTAAAARTRTWRMRR